MNQDSHFVFDGGTLALDLLNTCLLYTSDAADE